MAGDAVRARLVFRTHLAELQQLPGEVPVTQDVGVDPVVDGLQADGARVPLLIALDGWLGVRWLRLAG